MNRTVWLAMAVVGAAAGARRLTPLAPDIPALPSCAHRVLVDDGVSTLLGCDESLPDGDRLVVGPPADAGRMAGPALRLLGLPVDLNLSSVEDLESLPGVGPKLAERIAAARPFHCPSELRQVAGIGPKRWSDLRSAVAVDPSRRRLCADHL